MQPTYRQLHLIVFVLGVERPPSFYSLLFENVDLGDVSFKHVERTLLGALRSARKAVQIESEAAWREEVTRDVRCGEDGKERVGWDISPRKSSAEKWSASHTCKLSRAGTFVSVSSHENKLSFREMTILSLS